jgi:zinc transport system ATP-binding protein
VLIARALASEPEVLVMDEPTAGVDAANQASLARTLERLVAQGLTLLIVTHEIEPLAGVVTRVVTVEDGRIVREGVLP